MLNDVSELFEFTPCKVALDIDTSEDDLLNLGVCCQACLNSIETFLSQRISTQVDNLQVLRFLELHEKLLGSDISYLTIGQTDLCHCLTEVDCCSDALGTLRFDR